MLKINNLDETQKSAVLKLEISPFDLLEVIKKVVEETVSSIYSKIKEAQNPEFMTRKEAMKFLDVKTALTMIRWEEKGYITPHKIGGRIYYRENEVKNAFEEFTRSSDY